MGRGTALGLLLACALSFTGCGQRPHVYHFKLTVLVETPTGVRRGSSVYAVSAIHRFDLQPGGVARAWDAAGEAAAVELPDGDVLFALRKTGAIHGDMAGLSMTALDPAFRNDVVESAARISDRNGVRSSAVVAPLDYPMLVRFRDIGDPRSVERVDPADLATSFGPRVRLQAIVAEVTDEPISHTLERYLPSAFWERRRAIQREELGRGSATTNPYFDSVAGKLRNSDFSSQRMLGAKD